MTRDNRKSWRAESRMAAAALSTNQQQSLISAGMTAPIHTAAYSTHTTNSIASQTFLRIKFKEAKWGNPAFGR